MENLIKRDDLGVPQFLETPIHVFVRVIVMKSQQAGQLEVVQFLHDGYTLFHPRYLNRNSVKLGRTWLVGEDSADFSGKVDGRSLLSKDILNGCRLPSKPLTENCIKVTSCFFFLGGWRLPPKESSQGTRFSQQNWCQDLRTPQYGGTGAPGASAGKQKDAVKAGPTKPAPDTLQRTYLLFCMWDMLVPWSSKRLMDKIDG